MEMSKSQEERQKHREDDGKYVKVNPCYVCGKSAGEDYNAHPDTDGEINDELICICDKCYDKLGHLPGKEAVKEAIKMRFYNGATGFTALPDNGGESPAHTSTEDKGKGDLMESKCNCGMECGTTLKTEKAGVDSNLIRFEISNHNRITGTFVLTKGQLHTIARELCGKVSA